jgi:outer membrane PBP1 activator LpoA protein
MLPDNNVQPQGQTTPAMQDTLAEPAPPLYQQPARELPPEQNQHQLQAIDALIQAGNHNAAQKLADALDSAALSVQQRSQLNLIYAQVALNMGEAEQALGRLELIQAQQLSPENRIKYFQSQAFAFSLTGRLLDSVRSRIELNQLLSSPDERDDNHAAILETLSLMPEPTLQNQSHEAKDELAGWLSLTSVLKLKEQDPAAFDAGLAKWRETFPGHPANSYLLKSMAENTDKQSLSIAVLLPESGPFAQAAKAMRAGFMAAYDRQDSNGSKPTIRFYDTEQSTAAALYNQAVTEGAAFIVGPLNKEHIQSLADSVAFDVPVLALNHIPGLQKQNLYQFSLSPMDDVEQISHKAWLDGRQKALLLIPENDQGKRIANFFIENWQGVGGSILELQSYNPKTADFSPAIKKLLNIDESEGRYHKISQLIPSLTYTPRQRQDADALLLSAYSGEARLINPQLQYYQAGSLSVYALPAVYSGQPDPALDQDLNKITFCDTPWLLDSGQNGLGMSALQDIWRQFTSPYLRLIAMGIDAYNLIDQLDKLDIAPYSGATGILSLMPDGRIKRELVCAKFMDGRPELIDTVNPQADTPPAHENQPAQTLLPMDEHAE